MERLTARNEFGDAFYPYCLEKKCNGEYCAECEFDIEICKKLAEYEDLGVTPEQIREIDKAFLEKCEEINRLKAELEEVRRNGT